MTHTCIEEGASVDRQSPQQAAVHAQDFWRRLREFLSIHVGGESATSARWNRQTQPYIGPPSVVATCGSAHRCFSCVLRDWEF